MTVARTIVNIVADAGVLIIASLYFRGKIPLWSLSLAFVVLGIVCWSVDVYLMRYYIAKRAPEMASTEEIWPGIQAWELTTGLGIVPKWVSYIGLFSISCFMAAVALAIVEVGGMIIP